MKRWQSLAAGGGIAAAMVFVAPQAAHATWRDWNMGWGYGEAWGGRGGANDGYFGALARDLRDDFQCVSVQMAWSGSGGWRRVTPYACYTDDRVKRNDAIHTRTYHVYARLCRADGPCSSGVLLVDDGT